jgi:hypothetical protein
MRDFHLVVPADCVASNTATANRHALRQMKHVLQADIGLSHRIDLFALKRAAANGDHSPQPEPVPLGPAADCRP